MAIKNSYFVQKAITSYTIVWADLFAMGKHRLIIMLDVEHEGDVYADDDLKSNM